MAVIASNVTSKQSMRFTPKARFPAILDCFVGVQANNGSKNIPRNRIIDSFWFGIDFGLALVSHSIVEDMKRSKQVRQIQFQTFCLS